MVADSFDHPDWALKVKLRGLGTVSKDSNHCLQMYDWFFHHGPNGRHFVMAFEVLGRNLLNLIRKYRHRGIPLPLVREITR